MRFWLTVVIVAGAGALVTVALGDHPVAGLWWALAAGGAVAAVALGVRRHAPTVRLPWWVLLGSLAAMWIGWSVSGWLHALGDVGPREGLMVARDLLYFVGYTGVGVAALLAVRARIGGADRDSLIDALVVMLALAMLLWVALPDTAGPVADLAASEWAWRAVGQLLMAAVIGATVRVLFSGGMRLAPAWLLFAAATLSAAGNVWASQRIAEGIPQPHTGSDVLWVLAFVAIAAAAHHPAMSQLSRPISLGEQRLPTDRIVLLGAALLAPPAAFLQLVENLTAGMAGLVAGSVAVSLLVVWRMVRLLNDREQARKEMRAAADRDAAVAELGSLAVGDRPLHWLLADADDRIRHAIAGHRCGVMPAGASDIERAELGEIEAIAAIDDGVDTIADVVVARGAQPLSPADRRFLAAVAALLSAAARQRVAEAQLRHRALHDDLTGLPGRVVLLERLAAHLADRREGPVAVAFIDLDRFKAINDTLGHAAGDRVLVAFAGGLRAAVRAEDTVARLAGDEFVVVVRHADPVALRSLIGRVRDAAHAAARVVDAVSPPSLGVSVGIARARPGEADAEKLLQRADALMYRAKQSGGGVVGWSTQDVAALGDHVVGSLESEAGRDHEPEEAGRDREPEEAGRDREPEEAKQSRPAS